ncbi:YibE/F family protein [Loigolactobacillus zhaoyuanensis]|uniref:YibE/F family protein n=1 Tax=Loigolactobacillus zhaoyuanensis TaxID=2486017 RepID=UPI000F73E327|nr:YibE/F family protein [Loigolactobacillus zhaoyuanensis]
MSTIMALSLVLLAVMILVGGRKGAMAFLSIWLNFGCLFLAIVLVSLHFSPIMVTLILGILMLALTIFVGQDDLRTTQTAFFAAVLVLLILLALIVPIEHWAAVQGFGMEDSDELEGMSLLVGINFVQISIATAVLSTLGAIAEAAMAIAAGLSELIEQHPTISRRALFKSGLHVGQQIIGTTFNTLFFGFFGGLLGLFIWFADLNYTWGELLNNKVLDAEIILVLLALISVILTVPMTTWVMAQRLQISRKKQS